MLTKKLFEKFELTPEQLKPKFEAAHRRRQSSGQGSYRGKGARPNVSEPGTIEALINRACQRVRDGRNRNFSEAKVWWAVDRAFDVSFSQVSPTLLEGIIDSNPDQEKVKSVLSDWGLSHLITWDNCSSCNKSPCSCGAQKGVMNLPVFFRVFIPIVKAYVSIRWAKIFNDRNVYPLFRYDPLKNTPLNRLRSEIITDRVQIMSEQMGYAPVLRQEIFHALMYSFALLFPKEHWYEEKKKYLDDDDKVQETTTKEGIRYHIPHPSRTFYDPADRLSTFNYDNGCEWAGYWSIVPYRWISGNDAYFNKDMISYGEDLITQHPSYFDEIYPCRLRFPSSGGARSSDEEKSQSLLGANESRQRDEQLSGYYTNAEEDKAVTLAEYYEKLIPSENGLGDYDSPIWIRLVLASDDAVVYAEPFSYCPVIYAGYDADENRTRNSSLALETMPWQDHTGIILSQYILSVKQNLTKVVFYNRDIVDEAHVTRVANLGEKALRGINYIGYSEKDNRFTGNDQRTAFQSVSFPAQNTSEIASVISTIINIMERLLVMSAQELGQPATHEQSATETQIISNNTSTRLQFTGSFIDEAIHAQKKQLYDALMANGSEEVYAQIQRDPRITEEVLEELGFSVVEGELTPGPDQPDAKQAIDTMIGEKVTVRGPKTALTLEGFAAQREGENRVNGPQVAAAMVQLFQSFASNQMVAQSVGPEQMITIFNKVARIAGMPDDFRLRAIPMENQSGFQDIQSQLGQMVQANQQQTFQEIAEAISPLRKAIDDLADHDANQDQAIQQLAQQFEQVATRLGAPAPTR